MRSHAPHHRNKFTGWKRRRECEQTCSHIRSPAHEPFRSAPAHGALDDTLTPKTWLPHDVNVGLRLRLAWFGKHVRSDVRDYRRGLHAAGQLQKPHKSMASIATQTWRNSVNERLCVRVPRNLPAVGQLPAEPAARAPSLMPSAAARQAVLNTSCCSCCSRSSAATCAHGSQAP